MDVQRALQTLGLYTKGIDGNFGRGSQAAFDEYTETVVLEAQRAEAAKTLADAEEAL